MPTTIAQRCAYVLFTHGLYVPRFFWARMTRDDQERSELQTRISVQVVVCRGPGGQGRGGGDPNFFALG